MKNCSQYPSIYNNERMQKQGEITRGIYSWKSTSFPTLSQHQVDRLPFIAIFTIYKFSKQGIFKNDYAYGNYMQFYTVMLKVVNPIWGPI